jgi:hypothetical protein
LLPPTHILFSLFSSNAKERMKQVHKPIRAGISSPYCPFCEVYELEHPCQSCQGFLSKELLAALRRIKMDLPYIFPKTH